MYVIFGHSASFCYSFKHFLRTGFLYCWSFNNFGSSLILQFFKCHETKPLQVWSLPPRKTKLLSKNFVLQFVTIFRSSHQNCTFKKMLLKIWEISHENTCAFVFNKAADLRTCNFIEKDSNAGVSCESLKNFKNNNFEEHLWTTVPVRLRKISPLLV